MELDELIFLAAAAIEGGALTVESETTEAMRVNCVAEAHRLWKTVLKHEDE
jgi:hypothetical protein